MDEQQAWAEVLANEGLVKFTIQKYLTKHPQRFVEFDELLTAGYIGCFKAAKTFDPTKGYQKSTYYARCIWNEISKEIDLLQVGMKTRKDWRDGEFRPGRAYAFLTPTGDIEVRDQADDGDIYGRALKGQREATLRGAEENQFEDDVVLDLEHEAVREAVMSCPTLSDQERDIVIDKFWGELTYRQIGEKYGVSKQRIEQIMRRALAELRVILQGAIA